MKTVKMILLLILLIPAISFAGVTKKVVERYPSLSSGTTALPGSPKIIVYTDSKGKEIARELCDETGKVVKTTGTIPDGIIKEYYESGKLESEYNYKKGKLEGKIKHYYESGLLREERSYKKGKLDGRYRNYYTTGSLGGEWYYENGKREGVTKLYWENGNIKAERNFKSGKQEGVCKKYYNSGELRYIMIYKSGKIISKKKYGESGKIIYKKN